MKTELREAMTSGVYVEFRDASGNTVGQALYTDWRGQPVPNVGDMMASDVQASGSASTERLCGRVVSRQFELQSEPDGTPCVWVQLIVAANYPASGNGRRGKARRHDARFSRN